MGKQLSFQEMAGMTVLERCSFHNCDVRRVVIPATVKRIAEKAFWSCGKLEEAVILGEDTVIEFGAFFFCPPGLKLTTPYPIRFDEHLHAFGITFLQPVQLEMPPKSHHKDRTFGHLAKACAAGDVNAMWTLADYFGRLGNHPFYTCAANFWRYRAHQYGFAAATHWLVQWMAEHPDRRLPAALNETLEGSFSGKRLRDTGFLFFDPGRSYSLTRKDADGIVDVSAWSSDEGPDEDGFGREECYDWWLLDEHLNPIPGVKMIHDFSRNDRRANKKMFQSRHDTAVTYLRK